MNDKRITKSHSFEFLSPGTTKEGRSVPGAKDKQVRRRTLSCTGPIFAAKQEETPHPLQGYASESSISLADEAEATYSSDEGFSSSQASPVIANFDAEEWSEAGIEVERPISSDLVISTLTQSLEQEAKLTASQDLGGHGGTKLIDVNVKGQTLHLFLKPADDTEYRNYKVIGAIAPRLQEFMPTVYGRVEVGDKTYMVMENTRLSPEGQDLAQLADIKLAGKIERDSDFHPIADQAEMKTTRGKRKSRLDYLQMLAGASKAPNFMIAGKGPRAFRLFAYASSKENLLNTLNQPNVSSEQLRGLATELERLTQALSTSPVVFIGASVIVIRMENGDLIPKLIDPAHMQVRPSSEVAAKLPNTIRHRDRIYFGPGAKLDIQEEKSTLTADDKAERNYANYQSSNMVAMEAIMETVAIAATQALAKGSISAATS